MATATDTKSSSPSEIKPLEELDETDAIAPPKEATDENGDQQREKESDKPAAVAAAEQEILVDGIDGQAGSGLKLDVDHKNNESQMHLDKDGPPAGDPQTESAASNTVNEREAFDADQADDVSKKEAKSDDADQKQDHAGKDPAAASSSKIIVATLILFFLAGALIYSGIDIFSFKGMSGNGPAAKTAIQKPAEPNEIQAIAHEAPIKNDPFLSTLEEVSRLREELLAKKEEIHRLKLHYRNGIIELKDQIGMEIRDANVSDYSEAIKNRRIELSLRIIQRRQVYIEALEKPIQWLHYGSEELLFLKRKALLDLQMQAIVSGIDLDRHMRYMNAAIQQFQPSAEKLAVDPSPAELMPLEGIWGRIIHQEAETLKTPIGPQDEMIMAEICSGDFTRIADLTAITPQAAKCLSRMNGSDLFLKGLTQLAPEEAQYLFQWPGSWICLNGVKKLSPAVARYLFKWGGNWISLNGLTEFPPELALYLMEWKGKQLELMGLNCEKSQMDQRTLKYLALWETMGGKLFVSDAIRNEIKQVM